MKELLVFITLASNVSAFGPGELRVDASSTRNDLIRVSAENNISPIQAKQLKVTAQYKNRKAIPKVLIVLFDPRSHLYLWTLTRASTDGKGPDQLEYQASRSTVAIGNGRLVWFIMGQPDLGVTESPRQARNLDEACQHSLHEAAPQPSTIGAEERHNFIDIEVGPLLGAIGKAAQRHFFIPDLRSEYGPFPVHLQALYRESRWEITIEANLKAKVILGNTYQLLSVEQIPGEGPAAILGRKPAL